MIALLTGLLSTAVLAGSVLALAAQGEVMAERTGVTSLGTEGIMSIGAVVAVLTVMEYPDPWLGFVAAMIAGGLAGAIFAFAVVILRANQVLCGLATTFLGIGLSAAMGHSVAGLPVPVTFTPVHIPLLSAIPLIGPAFFSQNILVCLICFVLPAGLHHLLFRTRHGLNLRAVGENPAAADAAGISVAGFRFWYTVLGTSLAGGAGACLSLAVIPGWTEGMVSGRGWIAVALVIFAGFRPVNAVLAGLVFGLISALGFLGQAESWPVAAPVLNMFPYLGTLGFIILPVVLWPGIRRIFAAPAALGEPYYREVR
ncbi:ABC transporter permease [Acetobacter sp. AN02]|uniref:ABC transporter permease n=1 Tax=Acetobacter sp. AN02 TaxID=2894186 RepID=UPI002434175F|nr:ABC transporter permease [Acetobacter sp. AN02]MDG6095289.1 ABC transporter permease [Acetobacter sp. AN02]